MERETTITDEKLVLNPQITDVEIGIRNLRKIKIYPLSVAQQWEMSDLITVAIQAFVKRESGNDYEFVSSLLSLIRENLSKALALVTDLNEQECDELFKEMTNTQVAKIIETIYTVNYKPLEKNAQSLLKAILNVSQSGRPSPTSVSDTTTASVTSPEATETVE